MRKHIAVTGATGFVGRGVVDALLAEGHRVSVLVRNEATAHLPQQVRIVGGDLKNAAALLALVQSADVVVHIAGAVTGVDRQDFIDVNVTGTAAIAGAARSAGVKRFVYVSSLAATEPELNAYAESKAQAEQHLSELQSEMSIAILRPAAIYGPGDTATLPLLQALTSRIAFIPGTPNGVFSLVHVDDVVRALVAATTSEVEGTFELDDGGDGYHWADMLAVTRHHFSVPQKVFYIPKSAALVLGRMGDWLARFRRAPSLINRGQIKQIYHPDWRVKGQRWPLANPIKMYDGLPATITWYQAQGMLPMRTQNDMKPPQQNAAE